MSIGVCAETLLEAEGKKRRINPHTSVPRHPVNWKMEKKSPLYSLVVSAKPTAYRSDVGSLLDEVRESHSAQRLRYTPCAVHRTAAPTPFRALAGTWMYQ